MSRSPRPSIVALAGPNGAGKSTAGPALLKETLGMTEFVNADTIARVMREESLPCNLESRIQANDIPANRAALDRLGQGRG